MAANPHEAAARTAKALKLADVFASHLDGESPDAIAVLPETGWERAAFLADVSLPSEATRAVVVTILRQRSKHTDPFAGFGSAS